VPTDYTTVQTGIDAATSGDTVLVDTGTYFENINFNGKAITIASHFILDGDSNHINKTIIDGSQPADTMKASVVTFDSGEDTTSILMGFTITGGTGTTASLIRVGGGILCDGSGATILNNHVVSNIITTSVNGYGGGLTIGPPSTNEWIIIKDNRFINNKVFAGLNASGAGCDIRGNAIIIDNEIVSNECSSQGKAMAAGLFCASQGNPRSIFIEGNTIKNNLSIIPNEYEGVAHAGGLGIGNCIGFVGNNFITYNQTSASTAGYGAGVLFELTDTKMVFEGNHIAYNNVINGGCWGGGLCILSGGAIVQNNYIHHNAANHGGGIYVGGDSTVIPSVLINNTIVENIAHDMGGGICESSPKVFLINSIVWGNTATFGSSLYEGEYSINVIYSDIEDEEAWPGEGNVVVNPEFKEDGYHLSWSSMLVNQGIDSVEIDGIWYLSPLDDIDGDDRPYMATLPDIGADEAPFVNVHIPETNNASVLNIQAFPNPFASTTTIEYKLKQNSFVTIIIYNQLGEQIEVIWQTQSAGKQQVVWNAEGLLSGVYYCVFKTKEGTQTMKMIKLK